MADPNEAGETALAELNKLFISEAHENAGERETATDDIPPSLISYFETSKSRAVVCESLILEDFEDMKNLPIEFDGDVMKPNKQINIETENEDTSTDNHLLCAPSETDVLLPHNVAVCSHTEDKGETEVHMESARHLAFKVGIPKTPVKEGDIMESSKHREKQLEEMTKEKQRVQRENDFQEELKKIIEAEKLHQMELQLMGKRAQERLEDELLLRKELISNFQKQVKEERRIREEELKRIHEEEEKKKRRRREEEDRRKRHDEKMKRDMQSIENEMRRKKEEVEKRRIEEARLKAEEERRNNEELGKNKEECKGRVENDGKWNKEEQKTKAEEGMGKVGGERKPDGSEEEEKRKQIEEGERKKEKNEIKEKKKEEVKEKEKDKKEEEVESRKREEGKETRGKRMEGDKSRKDEEKILEQLRKEKGKTRNEADKRSEEEMSLRNELEEHRKTEEEIRKAVMEMIMKEKENRKIEDEMQLKINPEKEQIDVEWRYTMENNNGIRQENEKIQEDKKEKETINIEERRLKEEESKIIKVPDSEKDERLIGEIDLQQEKRKNGLISEGEWKNSTGHLLTSQLEDSNTWLSSSSGPSLHTFTDKNCETIQQHIADNCVSKPMDEPHAAGQTRSYSDSLPLCLPERTEQKRLSWMKDCVPWSKLSLQNRRKRKGSARSGRVPRRPSETSSLPPLRSDTLLQSAGSKSLQEVTTVTLEDLPGCNLSTLLQCSQLRSLTLRRCGLKSLQGISQLPQLCYIDVEENDISFVDCENMTNLRVLRLGHNKLTSIHGLSGADNLDVLELSHNSVSRIAGLESLRRLQRLSVDHNQLISTEGLRDIYTLLHLNCSYNHLASVEGLENSPLLNTLDLRANGLTESPSLTNHVLLRELRLDDNSISSLQGLTACWLPLMQHLSVAQNRITQLPPMSDFIMLENLDLRFNCMSELQNVCESLEGCQFLQNIHLKGNPLQQESGWRSSLQGALLGLRAIDDQETDHFLSPPAVQQIGWASVSFLSFCQTHIQQINDLQHRHSRELSEASSPLDAIKCSCQHFSETLKLAEDQRFAHEYGDINMTPGQTVVEKTVDMESTNAKMFTEQLPLESHVRAQPVFESRNCIGGNCRIFEEKSSTECWEQTLDTVTAVPSANLQSSPTKGKTFSSNCKMQASCFHQDPALQNTAAGVIQQQWRKYRQKCGSICSPPVTEKQGGIGRDGGSPPSGPFYINGKSVDPHYAATTIQAFWRGCVVRRRLLSALAAVTSSSTGEDDTFEEMDVDKFVFDEAALEELWTLPISDDSPSRHDPVSEEPVSLKVPGPLPGTFLDHFQYTLPSQTLLEPKQAWVGRKQLDPAGRRVSPESSSRKSPASTPLLSGIPERLEKILEEWGFTDSHTALLMLKRAQKMKSKQQQKNKCMDPSVRLALFRNCHYQLGLVEARNRPASHSRNVMKVCKTTLGLKQCDKKEQVEQWLQSLSDRDSVSEHFLPELSPDILKGGRVQLVADPAYTEQQHVSGLWDNSSSAAYPRKLSNYAHRTSLGHARNEVPSPQRVTSPPSKKERISFRDNPVQLSGGWGGGKKRDKVYK